MYGAALRYNADLTQRFVLHNPISQQATNLMSFDDNTIYALRHLTSLHQHPFHILVEQPLSYATVCVCVHTQKRDEGQIEAAGPACSRCLL